MDPDEKQLEPYEHLMPANVKDKWPGALAIYYAVVTNADRHIGRLMAKLDSFGLTDNTVFIFSADNGPEDIHVTNASHSGVGSSGPFRGRKRSLYEGGVRVPFILRWPGKTPSGSIDDATPMSTVDLLPTFCRLAGVDAPDGLDGEDMSDVFNGAQRRRKRPHMWEWRLTMAGNVIHKSPMLSILDGKWKLLVNPAGDRVELYDYLADPTELDNLAEKHPTVVSELTSKVLAWQKELPEGPVNDDAGSKAYPWPTVGDSSVRPPR